jgi:pyruvate,water dikinase
VTTTLARLSSSSSHTRAPLTVRLTDPACTMIEDVGTEAATLHELVDAGFPVLPGFVVTVGAYLETRDCARARLPLRELLTVLDPDDPVRLAETARACSALVRSLSIPETVRAAVLDAYAALGPDVPVSVRASTTAGLHSSFAGMHAAFADIRDADALLSAILACWASQYSPRGIAYRVAGRIAAEPVVAVVVSPMPPAEASGVALTADPSFGGTDHVVIEAVPGYGDPFLSGRIEPDCIVVAKSGPSVVAVRRGRRTGDGAAVLADETAVDVARLAIAVEAHLGAPQDLAWIVSGGQVSVVRSRAVTTLPAAGEATTGTVLVRGLPASKGTRSGPVRVLTSPSDTARLRAGEVLVAPMTSPSWVPAMRRAAALVTDAGGTTCHAAVVARELGVPAVVGTRTATQRLHDGDIVTVDGSRGEVRAGAYVPLPTEIDGPSSLPAEPWSESDGGKPEEQARREDGPT